MALRIPAARRGAMPVGEVPVPAVRSRPLGKWLVLSSANGSRLNAPERVLGVTGRGGAACARVSFSGRSSRAFSARGRLPRGPSRGNRCRARRLGPGKHRHREADVTPAPRKASTPGRPKSSVMPSSPPAGATSGQGPRPARQLRLRRSPGTGFSSTVPGAGRGRPAGSGPRQHGPRWPASGIPTGMGSKRGFPQAGAQILA
jgi:hypothetical protein